jgi:hypothetical protein
VLCSCSDVLCKGLRARYLCLVDVDIRVCVVSPTSTQLYVRLAMELYTTTFVSGASTERYSVRYET